MPILDHHVVGAGKPLLLIHGGAEDVSMLGPQAEALAAHGFRVVWYDRRGTAGTVAPAGRAIAVTSMPMTPPR